MCEFFSKREAFRVKLAAWDIDINAKKIWKEEKYIYRVLQPRFDAEVAKQVEHMQRNLTAAPCCPVHGPAELLLPSYSVTDRFAYWVCNAVDGERLDIEWKPIPTDSNYPMVENWVEQAWTELLKSMSVSRDLLGEDRLHATGLLGEFISTKEREWEEYPWQELCSLTNSGDYGSIVAMLREVFVGALNFKGTLAKFHQAEHTQFFTMDRFKVFTYWNDLEMIYVYVERKVRK